MFYIKDSTSTIDLLNTNLGIHIANWTPSVADDKDVFIDSPISSGSQLVYRQIDDATETLILHINNQSQNNVIRDIQDLIRLLEKAKNYWVTDWQNDPVYIEAKSSCETNTRYAIIKDYRISGLTNPYAQPFFNATQISTMDNVTLVLQREQWLSYKPGNSASVTLTSGETTNIGSWNYDAIITQITTNVYGHFVKAANGNIIFNYSGTAYTSSDDGASFSSSALSILGTSFDSFIDSNNYLFLLTESGSTQRLYRSTNNGTSWAIATPNTGYTGGIAEDIEGDLYTGYGQYVYKSTDNGANWSQVFDSGDANNEFQAIEFLADSKTVVAFSLNAAGVGSLRRTDIYFSTDNGVNWTLGDRIINSTYRIRTHILGTKIYIFTVGSGNAINIYLWENGKLFPYNQIDTNVAYLEIAGLHINNNVWYLCSNQTTGNDANLVKSVDNGITWVQIEQGAAGTTDIYNDVIITDENTIIYVIENDVKRLPQGTI